MEDRQQAYGQITDKNNDAELDRRFTYHPPKNDQQERYVAIRDKIRETAKVIRDLTPASAEQSLAFNALDLAMFYANAGIARRE